MDPSMIFNHYDLSEILNPVSKELVESKMSNSYKKIYYLFQHTRQLVMLLGIIFLLVWFINESLSSFKYGASLFVLATILAITTQKMRNYIISKYNLAKRT